MINELRELFRYRDLIAQLVVRDLRVRYKNSIFGFFWSLANPLVLVATITVIVKYVMKLHIPDYSAYLLVAYLPWMFFSMSLLDASQAVLLHHDLLKKVYFPREVLPISIVISNLIHFLLALGVFFVYLYLYVGTSFVPTVALLPVLILVEFLLIIGLSLFISCLNVFYEDTKYIVQMLLQVMFYMTPIMYLSEMVRQALEGSKYAAHSGLLFNLYMLNPLNALVIAYRKYILPPYTHKSMADLPYDYHYLLIASVVSVLVCVLGYAFFNRRKWKFAELLG
jgi:ABC-type polysaccharide/polyol phosphate export permease